LLLLFVTVICVAVATVLLISLYYISIISSPFFNQGFNQVGCVTIGGRSISYKYNQLTDNINALTLQSLSTNAKKEYKSNGKYHAEFQKFVNYYGVPDYGNKFVTAALDGSKLDFSTPGTFDFSGDAITTPDCGTVAVIRMRSMIVVMQVLGELENSIDKCSSCSTPTCKSLDSFYNADASYTGSIEMTFMFRQGSTLQYIFDITHYTDSLYSYADALCSEFRTCDSGRVDPVQMQFLERQMSIGIYLLHSVE
jgi:hypothetical protein